MVLAALTVRIWRARDSAAARAAILSGLPRRMSLVVLADDAFSFLVVEKQNT
jgi:hypothetical protein